MHPTSTNTEPGIAERCSAWLAQTDRRSLLQTAAAVLTTVPLVGCASTGGRGPSVDLGRGDVGLMNFALVLESLECAFYTAALNQPYAGMTASDSQALRNIRDVEIVHREFFRRVLGARAIPAPQFDFQRVNFASRTSVLTAAHTFESTGVAAYNGAGHGVRDPRVLEVAGKIVSVEARHVALLSDLLHPGSAMFAPTPLDAADSARVILKKIAPYTVTKLDGSHLPNVI